MTDLDFIVLIRGSGDFQVRVWSYFSSAKFGDLTAFDLQANEGRDTLGFRCHRRNGHVR